MCLIDSLTGDMICEKKIYWHRVFIHLYEQSRIQYSWYRFEGKFVWFTVYLEPNWHHVIRTAHMWMCHHVCLQIWCMDVPCFYDFLWFQYSSLRGTTIHLLARLCGFWKFSLAIVQPSDLFYYHFQWLPCVSFIFVQSVSMKFKFLHKIGFLQPSKSLCSYHLSLLCRLK